MSLNLAIGIVRNQSISFKFYHQVSCSMIVILNKSQKIGSICRKQILSRKVSTNQILIWMFACKIIFQENLHSTSYKIWRCFKDNYMCPQNHIMYSQNVSYVFINIRKWQITRLIGFMICLYSISLHWVQNLHCHLHRLANWLSL